MKKHLLRSSEMWAAIRKTCDSGKEWIDLCTLNCTLEMSQDKAGALDKEIPYWAKDNPIVLYAKVQTAEIGA